MSLSMPMLQGHAMLHVHAHAAWPRTCFMSMPVLHVHPKLHVHVHAHFHVYVMPILNALV
jgi:hypothetical protein